MRTIRCGLVVVGMLLCMAAPARADIGVSLGIGLPHVSIGINVPFYPHLVRVPGYPVYYAPRLHANYFFYDGMYWVYQDDNWYVSDWFDGPWWLVEPEFVPLFILRIPVYYYMWPPQHFYRWHLHKPPRWGERWGHEWEHRHRDWDRWERDAAPPPAPLPVYQQQYSGSRYPRFEEQEEIRDRNYRYQPRDVTVREKVRPRVERKAPAPVEQKRREAPPIKGQRPPEPRDERPLEKNRPPAPGPLPRREIEDRHRPAPIQIPDRYREPQGRERRSPSGAVREERQRLAPSTTRDREQGIKARTDESPRRYAPAQEAPRYREPAAPERRPPPGEVQREREQLAPRSQDDDQRVKMREQEERRERWQRDRKDEN